MSDWHNVMTSTSEPNIQVQTLELGRMLAQMAERDPGGTPTQKAITVFRGWLAVAEHHSSDERYFRDVLENYAAEERSNDDLFTMWELLHPYIVVSDDDELPDEPVKRFIGLPLA